nr:ADP-glyceromanno-heptose 6-epimerase [Bacteroidota bacterium]
MVIVTGAAGFIGSCLIAELNNNGITNIIASDDFSSEQKHANLETKIIEQRVHGDHLFDFIKEQNRNIKFIFHLGARTDTTEFDWNIFLKLNLNYSIEIFTLCATYNIPLVYASSAATYGAGENGYDDHHATINKLKPLNPYGDSKQEFDKWVLQQTAMPPFWAGLKFFNVYGPNEYHKARMASVIFHSHRQIKKTGTVKLFRSHKPEYNDGEQLRDFIYVKDVTAVCYYLFKNKVPSAIYNLGTGKARTFHDLVVATFNAMEKPVNIDWIDIPADIRDTYQYFTEAKMNKLFATGYTRPFYSLEEGVHDYVSNYLDNNNYL